MSFAVGVVGHFTARHHLVGNFGPASSPHEHRYRVEASVVGNSLQADGTLFDISRLQGAMAAALAELDGRDLNELEALAAPNPTAEVVARHLFARIAPSLADAGLGELTARVWESPEAYASYVGRLA